MFNIVAYCCTQIRLRVYVFICVCVDNGLLAFNGMIIHMVSLHLLYIVKFGETWFSYHMRLLRSLWKTKSFEACRFCIKRLSSFGFVSVNCSSSIYSVVAQQQKKHSSICSNWYVRFRCTLWVKFDEKWFIYSIVCICRLFYQHFLLWLQVNPAYHGLCQHQHLYRNQSCQLTRFLQ